MSVYDKYEAVVGLEVHAQLLTKSKAYSSDPAEYGGDPNTYVSVITLGHPGTLPKVNEKVVEYAVKMGLATNCTIRKENQYARKNYFYADLPKGYQITQDTTPICTGGFITVKLKDGTQKKIRITRIHMEEDAGKSMHDQDIHDSLIDLNRAGVPLIEIVSEPDIRSAEEAGSYLAEIRKILRYLNICDGNMEEGSLRCDANISVRLKGTTAFGNRCEVKNLNSMRNVQRAIEFEVKRQIDVLEAGGHIDQNTLNFDTVSGATSVLRSKEMANDYRYFPEPDLPPVILSDDFINRIKEKMPELPEQLFEKYVTRYGLSAYDAANLVENKSIATFFEAVVQINPNYKAVANWIMGSVKSYLNEQAVEMDAFPLSPSSIAELVRLVEEGKINNSTASQRLFPALIASPESSPMDLARELNLLIENTSDDLAEFIREALQKYPEKVTEYKQGKKSLVGLFMGEVMKLSKGKVDAKLANKLLTEELEK